MKKAIVMAAALALLATPVLAQVGIKDSAHDLSGLGTFVSPIDGTTTYAADGIDQICVFCHTPHYATNEAPLWNRKNVDLGTITYYTSGTFDFGTGVDFAKSDVPLCMSCHNGTMTGALTNLYGAGSGTLTAATDAFLVIPDGAAKLGSDFSNDHPVAFKYVAETDKQSGLYPETDDAVALLLRGSGTAAGYVWCSSCHNVHEPGSKETGDYPFLRMSNTQSELCLTCHKK